MLRTTPKYKSVVAALLAGLAVCGPLPALAEVGSPRAAQLLADLATAADATEAARLEREISLEWAQSGSAAMDLLLKRGRDAMEVQERGRAIEHLLALTDHAPDFAEGWYALAQAFFAEDQLGQSADALERCLMLNPNHFQALQGMGAILEGLGRKTLAYRAYSEAAALRPFDETVTEALERLDIAANGVRL